MEIFAALRRAPLAALLGLILAAALATAGGGHRSAPSAPDPALAAFLAAGGTLADLCFDGGAHGVGEGAPHCDACQPTLAGPLPSLARTLARSAALRVRPMPVRRALVRGLAPTRAWTPRAPPVA